MKTILNPDYRGFGMTYEEYCDSYQNDPSFSSLFGPPDDPAVWNDIDKLTEHVKMLCEHSPCNWLGDLSRQSLVNNAQARLDYLLSIAETPVDTN